MSVDRLRLIAMHIDAAIRCANGIMDQAEKSGDWGGLSSHQVLHFGVLRGDLADARDTVVRALMDEAG